MVRSDLEQSLHRLANYVECQLAEVFRELLVEKRSTHAQSIAYAGCNFVDELRDAAGAEGGET